MDCVPGRIYQGDYHQASAKQNKLAKFGASKISCQAEVPIKGNAREMQFSCPKKTFPPKTASGQLRWMDLSIRRD